MTSCKPRLRVLLVLATLALCAWLVAALATASSVRADPQQDEPAGAADESAGESDDDDEATPERGRRRALREKVIEKVRQARRSFMVEKLELDEATADALEALLEDYHRDLFAAQREARRARRAIVEAVEAGDTTPERFAQLERAHLEALTKVSEVRLGIFDASRAVLGPEQQARLQIALPAFERHVEKHIRQARRGGKKKKGRGGGKPGGRRRR